MSGGHPITVEEIPDRQETEEESQKRRSWTFALMNLLDNAERQGVILEVQRRPDNPAAPAMRAHHAHITAWVAR